MVYGISKELSPGSCQAVSCSTGWESQLLLPNWGQPAGLQVVGRHFPKRGDNTVFPHGAVRCPRGREISVCQCIGKFHLVALGFQDQSLGSSALAAGV